MARVFKIIMNILMILLVAAMCAVFVPPFVGITTATASEGSGSNIPTGAIVYATREALENLEVGDDILITSDNTYYIYEITEIDETNKELTVRTSESSETEIVQLSRAATKIVIVVPLLGYILLAFQSFTGFIILAIACALVVILFIIATVLNNQAAYEEYEEELDEQDEDVQYFQDLAAGASRPSELDKLGTFSLPDLDGGDVLKTQEIIVDPVPLEEESQEVSEPAFDLADETLSAPKDGSTDTIEDRLAYEKDNSEDWHIDELEDVSENESKSVGSITAELLSEIEAFESSFKQEESKQEENKQAENKQEEREQKEVPVSGSDTNEEVPVSGSDTNEEVPVSGSNTNEEVSFSGSDAKEAVPVPEINDPTKSNATEVELAIPMRSLDDLLQEAYSSGEDPHVVKDDVTGISFVDYSSCF